MAKRGFRVLKYPRIVIGFGLFLLLLTSFSFTLAQEDSRLRLKDVLQLNDNLTLNITGVYYIKSYIPKQFEGEEISITDEELKNMFLNRAIIVEGVEINYVYLYEYVTIVGVMKNDGKVYDFSYNLAGFGSIYLDDTQIPLLFGDPTKVMPPY